jgi:hypothetical protein
VTDARRQPSPRPYRLIVTDDPTKTLGQGDVTYHASMLEAANAFVKAEEPYKTIVYDDGCRARHLLGREERMLDQVCSMLGYEVEEVGA